MADLTGNSGWKSTLNSAIKQRMNWAITKGSSSANSSTVVISFWLKKDPNIQNQTTHSTDCRFRIECAGQVNASAQLNSSMSIPADNTERCYARATFTVPHNSDGTKSATFKVTGGFGATSIYYYTLEVSKTVTFPTIPRASTLNAISSTVIGNDATISWVPRSANFYYKLRLQFGETTFMILDSNDNEVVYHPNSTATYSTTYTVPSSLITQITDSDSGIMKAYLYTYSDSACTNQIGSVSIVNFTITVPSSYVPTISNMTVTRINKLIDNVDVIGSWQGDICVDGFTKYTFTVTASGAGGSTIASMSISGDLYNAQITSITDNGDNTYTCSYVGDYVTLNSSRNITHTITVKDSRGRVSSQQADTRYIYRYSNPIIGLFTAERDTSNSSIIIVNASSIYSSINSNNTLIGSISYRRSGTTQWHVIGSINPNANDVQVQLTSPDVFEDNLSYELKLGIYDDLGGVAYLETFVGTSAVLIDLKAGGNGLGIGRMAESDTLEIGMPVKYFDERKIVINNVSYPLRDMIDYGTFRVYTTYLESGFELNDNNYPIIISRVGNLVSLKGVINVTSDMTLSEVRTGKTFFTLPQEFRPVNQPVFTLCPASNKYSWVLVVETNGDMKLSRYGKTDFEAITAPLSWFAFNVTFTIDDTTGLYWPPI